jgi:hypothetical protein
LGTIGEGQTETDGKGWRDDMKEGMEARDHAKGDGCRREEWRVGEGGRNGYSCKIIRKYVVVVIFTVILCTRMCSNCSSSFKKCVLEKLVVAELDKSPAIFETLIFVTFFTRVYH